MKILKFSRVVRYILITRYNVHISKNVEFFSEISKNSRSLFLELDANASKSPQISLATPQKVDVKKSREVSS